MRGNIRQQQRWPRGLFAWQLEQRFLGLCGDLLFRFRLGALVFLDLALLLGLWTCHEVLGQRALAGLLRTATRATVLMSELGVEPRALVARHESILAHPGCALPATETGGRAGLAPAAR